MIRYVGIEAYEEDGYLEDACLIVRFGEDEVREYLSDISEGVRPGGYLEIDDKYIVARSDNEWMKKFRRPWDKLMEYFDENALPLGERPKFEY